MKCVHQSITLTLLAGALAFTSAQSADIPPRGPIPFAAFDLNGNGAISAQEFNSVRAERMAERAAQGRPMRHSPDAPSLTSFDTDGDSQLSPEELSTGQQAQRQKRMQAMGPCMGRGMRPGMGQTNGPCMGRGMRQATGPCMGRGMRSGMGQAMGPGAGMGRNMPRFVEFDLNNDGVLVEDEFLEARGRRISERARQGYLMRGLSSAPPFSAVDQNSDGMVTPEEFTVARSLHRQSRTRP